MTNIWRLTQSLSRQITRICQSALNVAIIFYIRDSLIRIRTIGITTVRCSASRPATYE